MSKKGFTIIEVVVVFLLVLGVTFLVVPKGLNTTKQARFISKWTQKYSELEYMFSVIEAQNDGEIEKKFFAANNDSARKKILLEAIKPYLRIVSEAPSTYKPHYMDKSEATPGSTYYFNNFYFTSSNEIVGVKLVNSNCKNKEPCAIMSFDINGLEAPNTWGYDIYGINVLKDGIEPLGKNIEPDVLKNNCSKYGTGIYCSYYYLIGGRFD